ncbi:MAG TPA: hypothetical protein DCW90_24920 [Lachnospiraceae bacterium]|nr:hypothetical protein [Lachnospiraceae bacterium]
MARILTAGITELEESKFQPITNGDSIMLNKPSGGLWGSTYTPDEDYPSHWIDWCVGEQWRVENFGIGVSYELKSESKVIELAEVSDYLNMMDTYGMILNPINGKLIDIGSLGAYFEYIRSFINFEKLSRDYDAFHLTKDAFYKMRMGMFTDNLHMNRMKQLRCADFYSYDCETWIIFNFDSIDQASIQHHEFNVEDWINR